MDDYKIGPSEDDLIWDDLDTNETWEIVRQENGQRKYVKTDADGNESDLSEKQFCKETQSIVSHNKLLGDFHGEGWHKGRIEKHWGSEVHTSIHREDAPALVVKNDEGDIIYKWMKRGLLHREDGPAIYDGSGKFQYRYEGQLHRLGGPAEFDGHWYYWCANGLFHNEDGPAKVGVDGTPDFWALEGKIYASEQEWKDAKKSMYSEIKDFTTGVVTRFKNSSIKHSQTRPSVATPQGAEYWYVDGLLHRLDGAAVSTDEEEAWYRQGRLHRRDGPAKVMYKNDQALEMWYWYGRLHRHEGPAVIGYDDEDNVVLQKHYLSNQLCRFDGPAVVDTKRNLEEYYIFGEQISKEEYLSGTVAFRDKNGNVSHLKVGKGVNRLLLHRNDGLPAYSTLSEDRWYVNGSLHREDGPAVVSKITDYKAFFLEGIEYTEEEYWSVIQQRKERNSSNNGSALGLVLGASAMVGFLSGVLKTRNKSTKKTAKSVHKNVAQPVSQQVRR